VPVAGVAMPKARNTTMMKKKLLLNRETVRKLNTEDLHEIAGGKKTDSSECTILPMIPDKTFPANPLPVHP
jgi:hypothetical protein